MDENENKEVEVAQEEKAETVAVEETENGTVAEVDENKEVEPEPLGVQVDETVDTAEKIS